MKRYFLATFFVAFAMSGCASNGDLAAVERAPYAARPLVEKDFAKVQIGSWQQAQVLAALGRPNLVGRVGNFDGPVWSYRYDHFGIRKQFHVFLDPAGVVQNTGMSEESVGNDHHRER